MFFFFGLILGYDTSFKDVMGLILLCFVSRVFRSQSNTVNNTAESKPELLLEC